jgi:putative transposase
MTDRDPTYRRQRLPANVIAHAAWLYFRFPLSLRMVKDLLAARGIMASHQTVRLWTGKFGRIFANDIRRRSSGRLGDKWHLDGAVVQSAAGSIGSGAQLIRTASSWTFSFKAAETPRPPSALCASL